MNNIATSTEFQLDFSGSRHIICAAENAIEPVMQQLQKLESVPENLDLIHLVRKTKTDKAIAHKNWHIECLSSVEAVVVRLQTILARAYMGTRFYAVGSQQFVWDLEQCAASFGMNADEIILSVIADRHKRVFCSTCHEINTQVTTDIFNCDRCGIKLQVWSHYSHLKNAYLGVCADAEEVLS